jgi:hypothetical protein
VPHTSTTVSLSLRTSARGRGLRLLFFPPTTLVCPIRIFFFGAAPVTSNPQRCARITGLLLLRLSPSSRPPSRRQDFSKSSRRARLLVFYPADHARWRLSGAPFPGHGPHPTQWRFVATTCVQRSCDTSDVAAVCYSCVRAGYTGRRRQTAASQTWGGYRPWSPTHKPLSN